MSKHTVPQLLSRRQVLGGMAVGVAASKTIFAVGAATAETKPTVPPAGLTLPPLGYAYDALVPVIDKETMTLHHDMHHAGYLKKFQDALASVDASWQAKPVEVLLKDVAAVPESIRTAVRNQGGGHYNHTLFWVSMHPQGVREPSGNLLEAINGTFGDFSKFKVAFEQAGAGHFGSGWVWLAVDAAKKLVIMTTPNQDSPLFQGMTPLLGNDLWEHAYYLTYRNRRAEYLAAWWKVVDWRVVESRFNTVP